MWKKNIRAPFKMLQWHSGPWNPGWLIRIHMMSYENPHITGYGIIPLIRQKTNNLLSTPTFSGSQKQKLFSQKWKHTNHYRTIGELPLKETRLTNVPSTTRGLGKNNASWWLSHPLEKYARQIGSSPQGWGWTYKIVETTTQFFNRCPLTTLYYIGLSFLLRDKFAVIL